MTFWHPPVKPVTTIDAFNRAALATGGVARAADGAYADYNGHRYEVTWLAIRGYWTCRYTWAGDHVVFRGSFAECLDAAVDAMQRGGRGSSVRVDLPDRDTVGDCNVADLRGLLAEEGFVPYTDATIDAYEATLPWQARSYSTGPTRIGYAFEAVRAEREQGVPATLFFEAASHVYWLDAVRAWKDARRGA